ncbi:hypothetical protein [Streptomyces hokutonensis]|uniref:hypothetical protein n=1 Tax=Streptomyces hokutonensis TaxID=1306990 RepID=UPI00036BE750|nr:hypothetical protein [Streptomyces hokutonensis]
MTDGQGALPHRPKGPNPVGEFNRCAWPPQLAERVPGGEPGVLHDHSAGWGRNSGDLRKRCFPDGDSRPSDVRAP